jgi:hypothetical protein
MRFRLPAAAAVLTFAAAAGPAHAAAPTLFPSDRLTVADPAQLTGKRVNLPKPDCTARPSDCNDVNLINQLDGFDVEPRVEIGLGRPVEIAMVTPDSVYVQATAGGEHIGLNRLVFSPARNTLFGTPVKQLREGTGYRLVVSAALNGTAAQTTFTTMSTTSGLMRMRRALDDQSAYDAAGIAPPARGLNFAGADGKRTVFPAALVLRINREEDKGPGPLVEELSPNTAVRGAALYAFGSFESPSWLTAERVIPQVPTKTGVPKVQGRETVGFTLIVPSGAKPPGGFPVAIFGPGITRSKYDLFLAADENASRGIATMATDPVGHAYGPRSQTKLDLVTGPQTFSGFGRGRDFNADGKITEQEGVQSPGQPAPLAAVALRDGLRQTALDNMALVRAIGRGVDVDGDGTQDLRRDGVTYYAQSLGGIYGTLLMGVDPLVRAALLNVAGGPIADIARLSPGFRNLVAAELRNRRPGLLNGGRDGFTESTPNFIDPPVTAPALGAVAIQEAGSRSNWIERSGSPEAYAPLLRLRPAPDVGAKRIVYQFAFGDQTVPNPTSASIMRAGELRDVTTYYRNDRTPTAGSNPHGFLLDPRLTGRNLGQNQVVDFLASEGATITDPDGGANVFEVPIEDPSVLERLNFTLPNATGEPRAETAADGPGAAGAPGSVTRRTRLRVTIAPRRVAPGRRVTLRITVRKRFGGRPVRGARILVAGRRATTNRRGRAVVRVLFKRRGPARATIVVRRRGAVTVRAHVRLRR